MATIAIGAALVGAGMSATAAGVAMSVAAMIADQIIARQVIRLIASQNTGPRMPGDLMINGASNQTPLPRLYGNMRCSGTVIAMTEPRLLSRRESSGVDGKGAPKFVDVTYWAASIAVAFGEVGNPEITYQTTQQSEDDDLSTVTSSRKSMIALMRVWADRELIVDFRPYQEPVGYELGLEIYQGSASQSVDPLLAADAVGGDGPAYRDTAYFVLEDFDLTAFGNVLPQFEAEWYSDISIGTAEEGVEGLCQGVNGDLYVCSHTLRTVTRLDFLTGAQKAVIGRGSDYLGDLPAHPWRCCADGFGSIWVTCKGDQAIAEISEATDSIIQTLQVDRYPEDICADDGGNLWITHPTLDRVTRVARGTGTRTTYAIEGGIWDICFGAGSIWVGAIEDVVRIDPSDGSIIARIPVFSSKNNTGEPGSTPEQRAFFSWGIRYNAHLNEVLVVMSGQDIYCRIDPELNEYIESRNTGTWPQGIDCASLAAPHGFSAIVDTAGNKCVIYSELSAKAVELSGISFPARCAISRDGKRLAYTNQKLDLVQIARL